MQFPRMVRGLGTVRPLLIYEGSRIGQHAVVKFRVIPGHDDGARTARTAAHGRPAFRILGQLHVAFCLDERQHFFLDKFRVQARHRVVLQSALIALSITAAITDRDGDHGRHPVLSDEIIQCDEQQSIGSVRSDDEGCGRAGHVLLGNIHGDSARVGSGVARDHQVRGVVGVDLSRRARLPSDAGINLAVSRTHREVMHRPRRHTLLVLHFRGGLVRGTDDEVAVDIGPRNRAVR